MGRNYVPRNDTKFLLWAENVVEIADKHCVEWSVSSASAIVGNAVIDFRKKLEKASDPNRGKIDVFEKTVSRKIAEKAMRTYVQGFLAKNPKVCDSFREQMGITVYDTTPTPVPPPKGQAEADISYPGRTQLQLHIKHVEGTPHDNKADYGYRIFYGIYADCDTPPSFGKELRRSKFTRQKKPVFGFKQSDSKKTAHFCIRYENSKGEAGPWGPMFSAVIP